MLNGMIKLNFLGFILNFGDEIFDNVVLIMNCNGLFFFMGEVYIGGNGEIDFFERVKI